MSVYFFNQNGESGFPQIEDTLITTVKLTCCSI